MVVEDSDRIFQILVLVSIDPVLICVLRYRSAQESSSNRYPPTVYCTLLESTVLLVAFFSKDLFCIVDILIIQV
jgi:hypothetical protein